MTMEIITKARPRVNASMLPRYDGRYVCLLGRVGSVSQDGSSFVLVSCDQQDVQILLSEPLNDMIDGIIEVIGVVENGCQVRCTNYVNFGDTDFDMTLYNEAVKLTKEFPQYHVVDEEE
ncbi:replication protein A 14 kDa subunit-like [Ptychodera flava]|uniref:replication protein A 14 kDa subunit-like n=1 Tax=Ptychodera flava TaxID=63121 RepID=UPI00396A9CC3